MGTIGFEGRRDYGAVGPVCNLSARLCSEAKTGQILVSQRAYGKIESAVVAEPAGETVLKGLHRPVPMFNVTALT
jgi:class 3 adenylate cyclase